MLSRYLRREPHRQREFDLALIDAGHLLAADGGLDHRVDVADREAVARRLGAVDADREVGLAEQIERRGIDDAGHLGELGLDLLATAAPARRDRGRTA